MGISYPDFSVLILDQSRQKEMNASAAPSIMIIQSQCHCSFFALSIKSIQMMISAEIFLGSIMVMEEQFDVYSLNENSQPTERCL